MAEIQSTDVSVCKSELETLAMAAYQAELNDAYVEGLITAEQKHNLTKASMEESIVFETKSFFQRKQNNESNAGATS